MHGCNGHMGRVITDIIKNTEGFGIRPDAHQAKHHGARFRRQGTGRRHRLPYPLDRSAPQTARCHGRHGRRLVPPLHNGQPAQHGSGRRARKRAGRRQKSSFETRLPELGEIPERPSRPGDKIAPELLTMKIITVLLSAAFLLCNCGGSNYTVSGHYGLAPGDSVFLFASNKSIISSGVMTADTTFRLKGKVAGTDIATLSDRDRLLTPTLIFLEAGDIRLEPREEGVYEATGTPLNDSLLLLNRKLEALRNEYIKMTPATPHEEVEAIFARFEEIPRAMMNANLDNIFGLWLFSAYEFPNMLQDDTRRAQIRPCMTAFSPGMQAHTIMQELQKELAGFENAQIGHRFTNLTLTDTQGEPISLSSLVEPGRWVLLDFWATWCAPCCHEIPHLREAYAAYKAKGFEIYAVSLDNDEAKWRSFTSANDMPWINVLGIDADKRSTAAAAYGITSIPANFLISPDGIIIAKNLRGGELSKKLAEMLE